MTEEETTEKKHGIEQPLRVKCPKHLKMAKAVKTFGALGPWKNQEERNHYRRSMAIAIYSAEHRTKFVLKATKATKEGSDDPASTEV